MYLVKPSFSRRSCNLTTLSVTSAWAQNVHTDKHSDTTSISNRCRSKRKHKTIAPKNNQMHSREPAFVSRRLHSPTAPLIALESRGWISYHASARTVVHLLTRKLENKCSVQTDDFRCANSTENVDQFSSNYVIYLQ